MDFGVLRAKSFDQYLTPVPSRDRMIRRSLSSKILPSDPFERHKLTDEMIVQIFEYLSIPDLVNVMSLCRRFYNIGKTVDVWQEFDRQNLIIGQYALHRLLERRVTKIRLSSARIFCENLNFSVPSHVSFDRLVYLDLSYAVYTDFGILGSIMDRTGHLKYLNIAHFPAITEALCHKIAKNTQLVYLNLDMCSKFGEDGILTILKSCKKLLELNLAWIGIDSKTLKVACQNFPNRLSRLNLAGMKTNLNDEDLKAVFIACPDLIEIDLSDCTQITSGSIKTLKQFQNMQTVSLSRCFGIEPMSFLELKYLSELNIHGTVTDDGVDLLRTELYPTQINESTLSTIARPSYSYFNRH